MTTPRHSDPGGQVPAPAVPGVPVPDSPETGTLDDAFHGLTVFDHLRPDDGEHVGYIGMTEDGLFVPFDRLHLRRGDAMELDEAEQVLEEIGLSLLAEPWFLRLEDGQVVSVRVAELRRDSIVVARELEDMDGEVAKALDMTAAIELALPTLRLIQDRPRVRPPR